MSRTVDAGRVIYQSRVTNVITETEAGETQMQIECRDFLELKSIGLWPSEVPVADMVSVTANVNLTFSAPRQPPGLKGFTEERHDTAGR